MRKQLSIAMGTALVVLASGAGKWASLPALAAPDDDATETSRAVGFVNNRNVLGSENTVSWSALGAPFAAIPYRFRVSSTNGISVGVSIFKISATPPYTFQTGTAPLPETAFANGDFLLFTGGENPAFPKLENPSPITISFPEPVYGVGAQLQPDDECATTCPFNGILKAFDKRGNLLGILTSAGISSRKLDNSVPFLGVLSGNAEIAKVIFGIDPNVSGAHPISINTLSLLTTRPKVSGAVYALTNDALDNNIVAFDRTDTGALIAQRTFSTGGLGIGDGVDGEGLGSQGALQLSADHKHLYAVNAGSNDITIFSVSKNNNLRKIQRIGSGGIKPISLTIHGDLLYALNYNREGADCGSIVGFTILQSGKLSPLPNSTRPLSRCGANPGDIAFNPTGTQVVVTEKATSLLTSYNVTSNGLLSSALLTSPTPSNSFPFSLAFTTSGLLIETDDFNDASGAGAASSFLPSPNGQFSLVSGPVLTLGTATCWVAITKNDKYAYVTNTNSGTISGYSIGSSGVLSLLKPNGITATTGAGTKPRDIAFSSDSSYVYVLNSSAGTVFGYAVQQDGSLTQVSQGNGLPVSGSNGLAAY